MTDRHASRDEIISPVKRALIEIRDLRARLARAEAARSEPIAIVGMGLRFPGGVTDAESFARLLWREPTRSAQFPRIAGPSMISMPRIPMHPER